MELQEVDCGGLDWNDLACNRDRRKEHVNAVVEFRVLKTHWHSWLAEDLLASQKGLLRGVSLLYFDVHCAPLQRWNAFRVERTGTILSTYLYF
jgi:hypothetical protein